MSKTSFSVSAIYGCPEFKFFCTTCNKVLKKGPYILHVLVNGQSGKHFTLQDDDLVFCCGKSHPIGKVFDDFETADSVAFNLGKPPNSAVKLLELVKEPPLVLPS